MGFERLLGNEHIKANLEMSLEKGHISHFYLISGPEGSGKHTLADLLAAAIQQHIRQALRQLYPLPEGAGKGPSGLHHH